MESINNHLPKVSYIKAIDGYLIGCFGLVFLTVLETIAAYHIQKNRCEGQTAGERKGRKRNNCFDAILMHKRESGAVESRNDAINDQNETELQAKVKMTSSLSKINAKDDDENACRKLCIDSCCKILFPCFFSIANILYFALNIMLKRK